MHAMKHIGGNKSLAVLKKSSQNHTYDPEREVR